MTSERLEEIRKRRALALQGGWMVEEASPGWKRYVTHAPTGKRLLALWPDAFETVAAYPQEQILSTATFIANAPADIDALLDEVARMHRQRDGLIAIMRATGLQVREWERDGEPWITVLPEGCKCEREIGDAPCPLHKLEAR